MKKILLLLALFILFIGLGFEILSFSAEKNVTIGYIDDYPLTFRNELG